MFHNILFFFIEWTWFLLHYWAFSLFRKLMHMDITEEEDMATMGIGMFDYYAEDIMVTDAI